MKNIVLTGFMASGKTTIGCELANILGYDFIDMDEDIIKDTGMSINQIFSEYGEKYFRKLETEKAKQLGRYSDTIISSGGGCMLKKENLDFLRQNGIIVFLDADFETIKSRLDAAAATRPLLQNQDIAEIHKRFISRQPFYANHDYKIHITADKNAKQCAIEIIELIKKIRG